MAGTSSGPAPPVEQSIEKYRALLAEISKPAADWQGVSREIVFTRDRIHTALRESRNYDPLLLAQLAALDDDLRRRQTLLRSERSDFEYLRWLANPPKSNWWWYPPQPSPAWTVAALFFLTLSISILADFTRRLFDSGPDEFGLLAIAVQALFAVGATSTFTTAGRDTAHKLFSKMGITRTHQQAVKFGATSFLLVLVACAWKFLPYFSYCYNDSAFKQQTSNNYFAARTAYGRAISLNPADELAHYNLGTLYENAYEYAKAADEYREAITIDPTDVAAYSNLSRLLLIADDSESALQVANDALKLPLLKLPPAEVAETNAALYRNRALAEYKLGIYLQAEVDAKSSITAQPAAASPYCVLAKVYTKQGRVAEARQAWQDFQSRYGKPILQSRPEPDCADLAQEALNEKR